MSSISSMSNLGDRARLASVLAEAAEMAKKASPPKANRGTLEERLRELRKENNSSTETASMRASTWQNDYKQSKLRERIAQAENKTANERTTERARAAAEKEKESRNKKGLADEERKAKREQDDLDWERKRNLLLGSIESSQEQARVDRERKSRQWDQHQRELDLRLQAERHRIKKEHEGAESELRKKQAEREQQRLRQEQDRATEARHRKMNQDAENEERASRERRFQEDQAREATEHAKKIHETLSSYRSSLKTTAVYEAKLDEEWATMEAQAKKGSLSLKDIPFPVESLLRRQLRDKKSFQTNALRWHPDKFTQKFGTALKEDEKEEVIKNVTEVFQIIQRLRKD